MYSYKIFSDSHLIYVKYSGVVSHKENIRCIKEYTSDPDFKPGFDLMVDIRKKENLDRTMAEFAEQRETLLSKFNGVPCRVAYVISSLNQITWKQIFHEDSPDLDVSLAFFPTLQDALEWMNISGMTKGLIIDEENRQPDGSENYPQ